MQLTQYDKTETLASRLADILTRLNSGYKIDPNQLAQEYDLHPKTIRRDFNRFERCNLPLQKEGKNYFLDPKYLGQLTFKDIKMFAQISGVQHLYPNMDMSFIRELLDSRANSIYSPKGYSFEDATNLAEFFGMFSNAIEQKQQVAFLYNNEIRIVEPYRLIHHHGSWYLAAVKKGLIRVYRLSRMAKSYEQPYLQCFTPDPQIIQQLNSEDSIWFGREKTKVILTVHKDVAIYFKQRLLLPEQEIIEELNDGVLLVSSRISHNMQLLPLVRYWIPHVKIINPEHLQDELNVGLKEYLES